MEATLNQIADLIGGRVQGDGTVRVTGLNAIRQAKPGDLTFIVGSRFRRALCESEAVAAVAAEPVEAFSRPLVLVDDPYAGFIRLMAHFHPPRDTRPSGIHPSAVIAPSAELGQGVAVGPHAVVGEDCRIGVNTAIHANVYIGAGTTVGADCVIHPNVVIREDIVVGDRCILHSGVVIGADGFGFYREDGVNRKVPQLGSVAVGDDVEIGANSAVDRATFGATVVGSGTKIDNLVQIGHNVELGMNCLVCGKAGIAGSAIIEDEVTIGAEAAVAGHIVVGRGVTIAGRSGVTKPIRAGETVSGFPATEHGSQRRIMASMRHLPETVREVRRLRDRLAQLEELLHGKTEDNS